MTTYTQMVCKDCNKSITMKDNENWVSLKCKCKCAIYYPSGHFVVIPKKVYIKNKDRMEDEQEA